MAAGTAALPPADLLPVGRRANLPYRAVRLIAAPLLRLLFRFQVQGRENIPLFPSPHGGEGDGEGLKPATYVVIANHLNWLDEFAILLLFPAEPRLHFLADPTILVTRKFQWWLIRTTGGYVPVVRERHGDQALFHHVDRCLELGGAIAIFPEGNYGPKEGELMPFKTGFAHFAIKAGVPVVPVALSGTKDLWFRKPIRVVIGTTILPAGHDPASLTQAGFERITELMPACSEPPGRKLLRRWLTTLF
ncbi:MAG TPA: 1-acyl-sn-glycerol-3-phosphate acyltransferase [Verrucomicrobiae bacterium]|nr:1-acyl-sn-glycerol-3-phosphate acyltransferase [Verrucomicrobiae bacterium]